MSILKDFDLAIACTEGEENGYRIGNKVYDTYLSNEAWNTYLNNMSEEHRRQYGEGGGKELEGKDDKPPKMAAFASSSRMIYMLSKDISGFRFEEKFATCIGGVANMDGYQEREKEYVFVEAKCREPYSHRAMQTIKQNYRPVYEYLREKMPKVFSCVMENIDGTRDMRVVFFCKGEAVAYFDIKQMICHMLGIANKLLDKEFEDKELLFLYLLYNPCCLKLVEESREKILRIYEETCRMADGFCFEEMFGHIVDFLAQMKGVSMKDEEFIELKKSFRFVLCDQKDYGNYFVNV